MRGIGVAVAALVCAPVLAFGAERRPAGPAPAQAAAQPAAKPPAQAATPQPVAAAGPPLPTHQVDEIGYPTVEQAMHALSQRPDLRVSVQGVWLIYDDADNKLSWSFPVRGVSAYPSVIRRQIVGGPNGAEVKMAILCEAPQEACTGMAVEFARLNALMAQRANGDPSPTPAPQAAKQP